MSEFSKSALAVEEVGAGPVHLGSYAAREETLPASNGKRLILLYLSRGDLRMQIEGFVPLSVLKQIGLSLRP